MGDTNAWLLGLLTRKPSWSQSWSIWFIAVITVGIGVADYLLGAHISLRSLYFVPVTLAVVWLGWRAAAVAAIASTAVWFLSDFYAGASGAQGLPAIWNVLITIASFLITIWTLEALVSLHRRMEERVRVRTAQLEQAVQVQARLRQELIEISAQERNSIGHEIHDGLCQHLTGAALSAKVHAERLANRNDPAAPEARELIKLLQDGIGQTRRLARGLLLSSIEPTALAMELQDLAAVAARQSETACRLELTGEPMASDPATAAQLYRIAQEAVRNAVNHASASQILILLRGRGRDLQLEIVDDGTGLPPPELRRPGLGLNIMAHRAAAIGGIFEVQAEAGQGTRIICRLAGPPGN